MSHIKIENVKLAKRVENIETAFLCLSSFIEQVLPPEMNDEFMRMCADFVEANENLGGMIDKSNEPEFWCKAEDTH